MHPEKGNKSWVPYVASFVFLVVLVQAGAWVILPRWYPSAPELEKVQENFPGQKCANLKPAIGNVFRNNKNSEPDILILGDSVSLAWEKNSWPWQTASRLQNQLELPQALSIEVRAKPGWGSAERLAAWKSFLKEKSLHEKSNPGQTKWPRVAIWQLTINDILDEVTVALNGQETRITGVCRDRASVCKKALFGEPVRGILSWWRRQKAHDQNTVSLEKALANSAGLNATKSTLAKFSASLNQTPVQGIVMIVPYLYPHPSPFAPLNKKASQLIQETGLTPLDLSPVLEQYPVEKLRCKPSDFVHPALSLHGVIAAELAGELSKRDWAKQP